MIKYKIVGVASGGTKNNLRGERVYLGENLCNAGKPPRAAMSDSGVKERVLVGQCSSGHERNAVRVINIYDEAERNLAGGGKIVEYISKKLPADDPFPYAVMDISDNGVSALADGGSVIYELSGSKLKLLSERGKVSRTKADNFFAVPKIFIALSRGVADALRVSAIEAYLLSGEDISVALQRLVSRADMLEPNVRKSAVAAIAASDVNPIYTDENELSHGKEAKNLKHGAARAKSSLFAIAAWSAVVVAAVVLICLCIGGKYGGI